MRATPYSTPAQQTIAAVAMYMKYDERKRYLNALQNSHCTFKEFCMAHWLRRWLTKHISVFFVCRFKSLQDRLYIFTRRTDPIQVKPCFLYVDARLF